MINEPVSPSNPSSLEKKRAFLRLPIEARRKILERQAKDLAEFYKKDVEWREIEGAEIIEY